MWILIAILSAIIFGFGSVIMKFATIKNCIDQYILLGMYLSGAMFFLAANHWIFPSSYSVEFILFAILIACGSFFGNWAVIKALELGPASLTAPMLNLNIPLIIFMSVFFYGETFNLVKVFIIALLLLALILVKFDPNEHLVIKNNKWFFFVILGALFLFLREGGLKITQEARINNTEILFFAYIICLFFTVATILTLSKLKTSQRPKELCTPKHKIKSVQFGLIVGICSGVGLYLYSTALSIGPASIVATIFSARSFVILICAYILHKERLSFFQICAFVSLSLGLTLSVLLK